MIGGNRLPRYYRVFMSRKSSLKIILFVGGCFFFVAGLIQFSSTPQKKYRRIIAEAETLLVTGHYRDSDQKFRSAMILNPGHPALRIRVTKLGEIVASESASERIEAIFEFGNELIRQNKFRLAALFFSSLARREPRLFLRIERVMGMIKWRMGPFKKSDFELAQFDYDQFKNFYAALFRDIPAPKVITHKCETEGTPPSLNIDILLDRVYPEDRLRIVWAEDDQVLQASKLRFAHFRENVLISSRLFSPPQKIECKLIYKHILLLKQTCYHEEKL
ncbi:hypothetical protein ACFL27_01195 [candidate division CSSED10-310 bacterium]|uniref:Tetratricopeptide repeat protein n=1 Tax=candidate division CSSED10-310 bacterium TaxID=2855610 RepID=A0ABV6YRI4_UNCC1